MIEMQQVRSDRLRPGTWVEATYEDSAPRIVYQCGCGKVNALVLGSRDPETGVMLDEDGEPAKIACERKTCDSNDTRTFVSHTTAELEKAAHDQDLAQAAAKSTTPASA